MKTSLNVLLLLFVVLISANAWAGNGTMGLYADSDATIAQVEVSGGQLNLYLVARDPVDNSGGTPSNLHGFEARLSFQSSSDFVMDATFPVDVVNVGTLDNLIVGFGEPLPVSGSTVVVASFVIYTSGQKEANIFLGPTTPASVPGHLALLDGDFNLMAMDPVSGDAQRPVFYINSTGSIENASWGTAKIMYR